MAGLVALAAWKKYAKKLDEDTAGEALYQQYLDSAESIVVDHLGYSPASAMYTAEAYVGNGLDSMQLGARPITTLTSLSVDGVSKDVSGYLIDGERITSKSGELFPKRSAILVTYTAGYATVPAIILLTIMRIAAILSSEAGENIATTSVSFEDGSRQFFNHTNFDKFLAPLAGLRIVRMP